MKRRGYSIIEAAIVLTAFMLLVGGMAWPVAQRIRADQDESERAYMESMKEAVVAYAMRSRTPGGVLQAEFPLSGAVTMTVDVTIPAGRPYLPCPDMDADGREDRVTNKVPGVITLTALVSEPQTLRLRPGRNFGMCLSDRGLFPWRTLGTKPADYWGQHYDYYVHPLLASPFLGFDETSDAAGYLSLLAVSRTGERCAHGDWLPSGTGYVRGGRSSQGALGYVALSNRFHFLPTVVGKISHAPFDQTLETAGSGNTFDANFLQDRRRLANGSGDQVEVLRHCWLDYDRDRELGIGGAAFVIVSHGRNGYGGLRYVPPSESRTLGASDCIPVPASPANAFYSERLNNNCPPTTSARASSFPAAYILISGIPAPGEGYDLEFDDLLAWMMPRQLFNGLAQVGALPKPPAIKIVEFDF